MILSKQYSYKKTERLCLHLFDLPDVKICTPYNTSLQAPVATLLPTQTAVTDSSADCVKTDRFADTRPLLQASNVDVDLPVTISFRDYLSGHDPVLEAISSQ